MNRLSVIIPVYNGEKYISRCLDSVLNQNVEGLEIIIVDDGSKDDTGKICKEYQEKDSRIKYFNKKNEGVSVARNYGIEKVSGKYMTFVDADDWLEDGAYTDVISYIEKKDLDIYIFNYKYVDENGKSSINNNTTIEFEYSSKEDIEKIQNVIIANGNIYGDDIAPQRKVFGLGLVWNKIYKTSIVKDNNIRFVMCNQKAMFEDVAFCFEALEYSKSVKFSKSVKYNYYVNNASAVHTYTPDIYKNTKELCDCIDRYKESRIHRNKYDEAFDIRVLSNICFSFSKCYFYEKKRNKKELKEFMAEPMVRDAVKRINLSNVGKMIKLYYVGLKLNSYFIIRVTNCLEQLLIK